MTLAGLQSELDAYIWPQFVRNASSLAALTLVCLEYVASLQDELRFIWRWPINRVKCIYLLARYLALFGLIINVALLFVGPLSTTPVDVSHCRAWFSLYTVVSSFVLFCVDGIAMLRVYALYNRDAKIGAFFSSLIFTEATLVTTCSSNTIGFVPFSPICDVEKTPYHVIYFTCGVLITQWSLLFFTSWKRKQMAGHDHIPVVRLVFREGAWVPTLVSCVFLFIVPYSLITGTSKPHIVLIWPITLHSIAGCRVILNMHRLGRPPQSTQLADESMNTGTDIQFTNHSRISVSSSDYCFDSSLADTNSSHHRRGSIESFPDQAAATAPQNAIAPTAMDTLSCLSLPLTDLSSPSSESEDISTRSETHSRMVQRPPEVYAGGNEPRFSSTGK